MSIPKDTPQCVISHTGVWLMEPMRFETILGLIRSDMMEANEIPTEAPKLQVTEDGVAIIPINGVMMKARSKFGGTSTIDARSMIREAVRSDKVKSIMLHIDSPGGHTAGTDELATDIRNARAFKPVVAHIDDLGASAAYWAASSTERITANRMGEVGSIGTYAVIEDTSGLAERAGVKVHVVSTGKNKGAFVEGAPVTPEQLSTLQARVDEINSHFLSAVKSGRSLSKSQMEAVTDGSVFIAQKALELGLIDKVSTYDEAVVEAAKMGKKSDKERGRKYRMEEADAILRMSQI